ncbi:MAG: branched-chain amino acid ABC transporter substrate-binding protein [Tepidiformaceae bacterium]
MRVRGERSRLLWLLASLAIVAALFAAACGGDDDDDDDGGGTTVRGFTDAGYKTAGFKTVEIASGQPIKIGISSALTGDAKGLGLPIADSAAIAAEGKTIKGHKVEIVREDDVCTADGGPAAADRLIKANVVAVVGPICSGGTSASLAVYDTAGITHISPSATAGNVTTPARAEGPFVTFFRVPPLNADEARAQAKFMKDTLKAKKAFVVFDTDAYGKGLSEDFQTAWKAGGGTIVGQPAGYEKKTADFKAVISSIKQAKPDVVYFAGFFGEATPFIQQLRADNDTKGIAFMGSDGVKNEEFLKAGAAAENTYHAVPGVEGPKFQEYAGKYKDAATATYGAEAYDAMTAILNAIEKVATDSGGKLTIDQKKLNEEIKKTNFVGASGTVKFKANGDRDAAEVRIFQVKAGKFVEIKN